MADTHSSDAVSCGTTACVTDELMALGVFGWMISVIFILIFMVLMRAEDPTVPDADVPKVITVYN